MNESETVVGGSRAGSRGAKLAHAAVLGIVAGAACAERSPHGTKAPADDAAPDSVSVELPPARSAEPRTAPHAEPGIDIGARNSAELMEAFPGEVCCKGRNECKGKGNCKTDRHACKGLNECKAQGGCKSFNCQSH